MVAYNSSAQVVYEAGGLYPTWGLMLTDAKARNSKPAAKPYRFLDAEGLHLFVSAAGGKAWRWRYQKAGKETLVTLL